MNSNHSIHAKLQAIHFFTFGMALVVTAVLLGLVSFYAQRASYLHDTQFKAALIARNSTAALLFQDEKAATELLASLVVADEVQYAVLFDKTSRMVAHFSRNVIIGSDPPPLAEGDYRFFWTTLDYLEPVRFQSNTIGMVYMRVSLVDLYRKLATEVITTTSLLLLGLLGASVLIIRLQRAIIAPITDLASLMFQVSRTQDYSVRALVQSQDEVGGMVQVFNEMLEQIQQKNKALAAHQEVLEQTVLTRTAELVKAKEIAEASSHAKSEFLASMNHELRTPLNAVLGFSQLLLLSTEISAEDQGHVREVERAGEHLLALVNDLIDLARIEAGKLEVSLECVPVSGVIDASLALVTPLARSKGISLLGASGSACEAAVLADPVRLRQVILNLLANAVKYNRPQGVVHLACSETQGWLRISITDNGRGIPADKQTRLFTAFDRLGAELGNIEGRGIGLLVSRRMMEAMQGRIGFSSTEGKGSTFWVELPTVTSVTAAEQAITPPVPHPVQPAPVVPTRSAARRVVLYIEDSPMSLRLMQQIFAKRQDLELRDAHTAELGLELARAEPPALILLDINLPGMDGYAALAQLKADPRTARIPIIAVTANVMRDSGTRGLRAGFATYLAKPIDISLLFKAIDKYLHLRERP